MSLVQHGWRQRARTAEGDQDDAEEEGEVEEESESSAQRGGIQPSLKDRNEAPSRELGISGEEGRPGTGRGGPTPPKKSRGTASLVLGVPLPDFVKGRLGPGTTKVTHERVEPSPMPGEVTVGVAAAARSQAEDVQGGGDVPYDVAEVVREYLIALHARDER
jgi:hypothetical protein